MERHNLTAPTDTMISDMRHLTQTEWFDNFGMITAWDTLFSVPMALIPTKFGLCFNFNMIDASELLDFNT